MLDTGSKGFAIRSKGAARFTLAGLVGCFVLSFAFFFVIESFPAQRLGPGLPPSPSLDLTLTAAFAAAGLTTIVLAPFAFMLALFMSRKT